MTKQIEGQMDFFSEAQAAEAARGIIEQAAVSPTGRTTDEAAQYIAAHTPPRDYHGKPSEAFEDLAKRSGVNTAAIRRERNLRHVREARNSVPDTSQWSLDQPPQDPSSR